MGTDLAPYMHWRERKESKIRPLLTQTHLSRNIRSFFCVLKHVSICPVQLRPFISECHFFLSECGHLKILTAGGHLPSREKVFSLPPTCCDTIARGRSKSSVPSHSSVPVSMQKHWLSSVQSVEANYSLLNDCGRGSKEMRGIRFFGLHFAVSLHGPVSPLPFLCF